jgi:hypothetical protein
MYSYESQYIDSLDAETAAKFAWSYRLIDDTLSVNNPFWNSAVTVSAEDGGMYPKCLALNDTSVSPNHVNFLGMSIRLEADGKLSLDVFDKRTEFPFVVNRYPHMRSLIPSSIPYGVFTGLLYRYYRICSSRVAFVKRCAALAQLMVKRGCSVSRLRSRFRAFLSKITRPKWSLRGIHLQLFENTGDL